MDFRYARGMRSGASAHPLFLLLLFALLPACAHMPESGISGANAWETRRARLESIQHWRLRARIGVVAATQSGSADLQWEEQGKVFTLKVSGAFGRGLIAIEGDADSVRLQTGKGQQLTAASAEDLILQQTGWLIPVNGMRRWMLGLPSGLYSDESFTLDEAGRIDKLRGGGWEIEYSRYGLYHGHELPDRIRMQNEQVKIRLAVIDWEILDANEQ